MTFIALSVQEFEHWAKGTEWEVPPGYQGSGQFGSEISFIPPHVPRLTAIKAMVCEIWGIEMNDLLCKRRPRHLVEPRWAGMLVAKKKTTCSLPEIGRAFGNRDHCTVVYGIRRAEWLLDEGRQPFTGLFRELEAAV